MVSDNDCDVAVCDIKGAWGFSPTKRFCVYFVYTKSMLAYHIPTKLYFLFSFPPRFYVVYSCVHTVME